MSAIQPNSLPPSLPAGPANRLARESSPYLLQHAHNPVDWYPWGDQAFDQARRRDCPIFLSVGYSTCYWCHVMERQVFEDPRLAALMNELFVNVKVDREQRPDVDDVYMLALQLMTGSGGWPMSLFLTPPSGDGQAPAATGLRPYHAGTYFPPQPTAGLPAFEQVMRAVSDAWQHRRAEVLRQAESVTQAVREQLEARPPSGQPTLDASLVERSLNQLLRTYDHQYGGFGGAPKFPQPANLLFLLRVYAHNRDPDLCQALTHTLQAMACGGMYDQIAGGFHRYSVDDRWLVPHFEKMLYDNGQLLETYSLAHSLVPLADDPDFFARVARQTADYLLRTMTDPTGAFWSAQDAEVAAREGDSYLWTPDELKSAIGDENLAQRALQMYGLDQGPNFQDPHHPDAPPANVLYLPRPPRDLAAHWSMPLPDVIALKSQTDRRLLNARNARPQPRTDDKVLANWNGLAIAGLAAAARQLDEPRYAHAAARAAQAVLQHMRAPSAGLYHTMRAGQPSVPAFLDDYAHFAHGLLELHRATAESRWLAEAARLVTYALDAFQGYDTLPGHGDLFVRPRSRHDGALPSAHSQMLHNLLDLFELTADDRYARHAADELQTTAADLQHRGPAMIHSVHALLRALHLAPDLLRQPALQSASEQLQPSPVVTARIHPQPLPLRDNRADFTITLTIAPGHHVYAHEAGDGLFPTELVAADPATMTLDVRYPPGLIREDALLERPIAIYEGSVDLQVSVKSHPSAAKAHGPPTLLLRYQACTQRHCLPPAELRLQLPLARRLS